MTDLIRARPMRLHLGKAAWLAGVDVKPVLDAWRAQQPWVTPEQLASDAEFVDTHWHQVELYRCLAERAELEGLKIELRAISGASGYLYSGGRVVLNSTHYLLTLTETLAHEIGHHVLGHDWTKDASHKARDEEEADRWGAELIVDPERHARAVKAHAGDLRAVCRVLGVTRRSLTYWRESHGLAA